MSVVMDDVVVKHAGGRPTEYRDSYPEQGYKLCLLGATDREMADIFSVSEQTLNAWKDKYPEFLESLTRGKTMADANIAKSLYHRALGYSHIETITATFQGKITDSMDVIKHYPPDTPAATLWLKNRQPLKWRDKQDIEITGANGGPIAIQDVTALSDADLELMISLADKLQLLGEVVDITPIDEDKDS